MSETATAPTPDNDTDGGAKILPIGHAGQQRHEAAGGAPPAGGPEGGPEGGPKGGETADAAWLDKARQEAARVEYECVIHAEGQFEACARWGRWNTAFGVLSAVLGALTAGTIATVLGDAGLVPLAQEAGDAIARPAGEMPAAWTLFIAFGALVAGVVAAAVRFLDPQGRAAQHGAAGKRYRALEDEARQFRSLEATADATRDGLFKHLQTMVRHRAEIHEAAPVIPKRAYNATREKAREDVQLRTLAGEAGRETG